MSKLRDVPAGSLGNILAYSSKVTEASKGFAAAYMPQLKINIPPIYRRTHIKGTSKNNQTPL